MFSSLAAIDAPTLALLAGTAGIAGLARGFSGFGAALIFVPAASALVTPAVAAPVLLMTDSILSLGFLPAAWKISHRKDVAVMAAGALVGIPLGTYVLNRADPMALRWGIALLAALMLALLISGWRYKADPKPAVTVAVGMVAGLFGGMAQLSGPPVVAYWLSGRDGPQRVRANIILLFAVMTVISIVTYFVSGLLSPKVIALAVTAGPLYGLGLFLGSRLFRFASEKAFRGISFGLIALSVLSSLPLWN